jgi:hypothetical protein
MTSFSSGFVQWRHSAGDQWFCPVVHRVLLLAQSGLRRCVPAIGLRAVAGCFPDCLVARYWSTSLLSFRLIVLKSLDAARPMMTRAASSAVAPVDPAAIKMSSRSGWSSNTTVTPGV